MSDRAAVDAALVGRVCPFCLAAHEPHECPLLDEEDFPAELINAWFSVRPAGMGITPGAVRLSRSFFLEAGDVLLVDFGDGRIARAHVAGKPNGNLREAGGVGRELPRLGDGVPRRRLAVLRGDLAGLGVSGLPEPGQSRDAGPGRLSRVLGKWLGAVAPNLRHLLAKARVSDAERLERMR